MKWLYRGIKERKKSSDKPSRHETGVGDVVKNRTTAALERERGGTEGGKAERESRGQGDPMGCLVD